MAKTYQLLVDGKWREATGGATMPAINPYNQGVHAHMPVATPGDVEGSLAGANIVAALILRGRDKGLPLPGACSLHTAGVDLTAAGDTSHTNAKVDTVPTEPQPEPMLLYAGGHDITHPYLPPMFGDLTTGFPPTILTSGTRDLLLSPTVLMHCALRRDGIEADLHTAARHVRVPLR